MAVRSVKLPPIESDASSNFRQNIGGQTYKLHGTKHYLPPQAALPPNQDTNSGELETWPAYASRSMSDTNILRYAKKELSSLKQNVLPKPKFLEALENYVHKEIIHLDCTDPKPNELRLQAYREVFEYLIGDFKTYRPLLSQIKDEYEKMLSHYREKIRELEPLKSMLVTVSEQCDQKILKIREGERQEIIELKNQKMELLSHIDERREEERSLHAQINKLQEEITKQYKAYRDESDMRKLLVSDMNDLRAQLDELRRSTGQGGIDVEDDPVRLKISLKVAREDLTRQANELNRIKADYGDVIPRRDFEMLEAKHNQLTESSTTLQDDFKKLKLEHDTLLDVHKQVVDQRDEYYTEADTLRRSATPRPEWKKIGKVVPGGPEQWREMCHKKRSAEILEALVNLMKTGKDGPDSFEGSVEETVPKFLRYEGKIKNRRLSKVETNKLMKAIWVEKFKLTENIAMAEFLHTYFGHKYNHDDEMGAEWSYSFNEALNNYQNDPHFKLFRDILNDTISETVYYKEGALIKKIMENLQATDNDGSGLINSDQFKHALSVTFPAKSAESCDKLCDAAQAELENTEDGFSMDYKALFTEDEEGHTGPFITMLLQQDKEEREVYVEEIRQQLDGLDPVTNNDFKRTLMDLDPQIDNQKMNEYISYAFGCVKHEVTDEDSASLEDVVSHLKKNYVHRTGPGL